MKNLYYLAVMILLVFYEYTSRLINSIFHTNIGNFGKFGEFKKYDPGGYYDQLDNKQREVVEVYRALLKVYFDILEAIFYEVKSISDYIAPDRWLSVQYAGLINDLTRIQKGFVTTFDVYISHHSDEKESDKLIFLAQPWWADVVRSLPEYSFNDFPNLTVNAEGMIIDYPRKRGVTLKYMAIIENIFLNVCKFDASLPGIIKNDIKYYNELITEHKEKRGYKVIPNNLPILTNRKGTARELVNTLLNENLNNWVDKEFILKIAKHKKINLKSDDLRSIIAKLQKLLRDKGYGKKFKIEGNKKGSYRMIVLASKNNA